LSSDIDPSFGKKWYSYANQPFGVAIIRPHQLSGELRNLCLREIVDAVSQYLNDRESNSL
jgi:hypothetical protein